MADVTQVFGELVRQWVDVDANRTSYASLRARVVEAATAKRRPVMPWLVSAAGAAAVAVAVMLLLLRWTPPDPPTVTFRVGTDQQQGTVGTYYHAPSPERQLELRFSDGSLIALQPGGGARVTNVRPNGATVLLEAGRAKVEVKHLSRTDWRIAAGPYSIEVVGTSFDVGWTVNSGVLDVEMVRGTVLVRGPGIETGVRLNKGERFVSQTSSRVERQSSQGTSAAAPREAELGMGGVPGAEREARSAEQPSPSSGPGKHQRSVQGRTPVTAAPENSKSVSWEALAADGDYASILRDAEAAGLASVLGSASAQRLGILADAARYTGRPGLAEQVLLKLRERFPGSGRAQSAAFVLGRLRDGQGDRAAALSWYEVYLRESPAGPLAAEALGRRMLSLHALGRADATAQAARQYLERYPSGAYSRHAQQLIGS